MGIPGAQAPLEAVIDAQAAGKRFCLLAAFTERFALQAEFAILIRLLRRHAGFNCCDQRRDFASESVNWMVFRRHVSGFRVFKSS